MSLIIRELRESDIPALFEMHQRTEKFPFPDWKDPLYPIKETVENESGRIVGAGFLKILAEPVLIIDKACSSTERAHIIRELLMVGKMKTSKLGIPDWHVFIKDNEKFVQFLIEVYGFTRLDEDVLYLRLE